MRTKFKPWAKPFLEEHPEVLLDNSLEFFPNNIYLEIGSGKGQFLLEMAIANPTLQFLGVEKNITCAGFTAKKLVENQIDNAKLIWGDMTYLSPKFINQSVNIIFLNFSDPWPKKRHTKRRLTSNAFLIEYARILKDNGEILIKTDNVDLYNFTKEMVAESPFFIIKDEPNYDGKDDFDKMTEYEKSFREQGQNIYRLILGKKHD